jgi:hypothetical protein
MFKVWLEWDCGQDYLVFTTEEKAIAWIDAIAKDEDAGLVDEFPNGYSDIDDAGLCYISKLEVDPEPPTY